VRGDRVDKHGHEQLVLGTNGTVFQDALARRHVRVSELWIAMLKRIEPCVARRTAFHFREFTNRALGASRGIGRSI
jgi:hypothetical protein